MKIIPLGRGWEREKKGESRTPEEKIRENKRKNKEKNEEREKFHKSSHFNTLHTQQ